MKVLVFAHVPPPHHGQSYMVKLMLDGFGGDRRKRQFRNAPSPYGIECYHVNARLSKRLEDIGDLRLGKFFLLIGHCLQAIWCHFRYGIDTLYYIPAPGKKSALYRDWVVMLFCRPFFKNVILHWHAAGLAKWLETCRQIRSRSITFDLMKHIDLSIVLSKYNFPDAEKLFPKCIEVVSNGIPDPCTDFEQAVLPRRKARLQARTILANGDNVDDAQRKAAGGDPEFFNILFVGHCTREKGLFDAMAGVALLDQRLAASGSRIRPRLKVAGEFMSQEERIQFEQQRPDCVTHVGFVSGEEKKRLFIESDCLCFPTFHYAESFGLVFLEAMAFGLPILASRWRSVPELFPPGYQGLVDIQSPHQVADVLQRLISADGEDFRRIFLEKFRIENHLARLAAAVHSIDCHDKSPVTTPSPRPAT